MQPRSQHPGVLGTKADPASPPEGVGATDRGCRGLCGAWVGALTRVSEDQSHSDAWEQRAPGSPSRGWSLGLSASHLPSCGC